ncbi:hypothetical protein LguiB_031860 [Lonicera macranthoides]
METGLAPGARSIKNSTSRWGGKPGNSLGKTSRNSLTTGITTGDNLGDSSEIMLHNQPK